MKLFPLLAALIFVALRQSALAQYAPPASGLSVWLSADTGVTLSGSNVTNWSDQSGNGNDAGQSNTSNSPTVTSAAINGKPAIHFDGLSSYLSIASLPTDFSAGCTAFVVSRPTDLGSYERFFDFGNGSANNNILLFRTTTTDGLQYRSFSGGSAATVLLASSAITQNVFQIFESSQDSAAVGLYKNGLRLASGAAGAIPNVTRTSNFIAKSNWSGDPLFQGDIAEILIYNRRLTVAERQTVEDYLNVKYVIVAAPSAPTTPVALAASSSQVDLTWSSSSAPVDFRVERKAAGETAFSLVAIVSGKLNSYFDQGLTPGTSYAYRVRAENMGLDSAPSGEVSVTTLVTGGALPQSSLALWLRADSGVKADGSGNVGLWTDMSGIQNDAAQATSGYQPTLAGNVVNGKPVVRFAGSLSQYLSLPNLMSGATAAEVLVVMRAATATTGNGLWRFGTSYGDYFTYSDGVIYDGFGSSVRYTEGKPAQDISQFHVYGAATQPGLWQSWIDGVPFYQTGGNAVSFSTVPLLGLNNNGVGFSGDIAEIVIYNRVLTASERQAETNFLAQKYALFASPAAPSGLAVAQLSPTQNLVSWDWQPTTSQVSFVIERKTGAGAYSAIATVIGTGTYLDNGVSAGQSNSYRVYATSSAASSAYSSEAATAMPMAEGGSMPVSGMKLWLMADGASESPVGYWPDYSGSGNDAWQSTYGSRPTLTASALNGKPVLHFVGSSSQYLSLPNLMSGVTAAEVLVVMRAASATTGNGLWRFGTSYGDYFLGRGALRVAGRAAKAIVDDPIAISEAGIVAKLDRWRSVLPIREQHCRVLLGPARRPEQQWRRILRRCRGSHRLQSGLERCGTPERRHLFDAKVCANAGARDALRTGRQATQFHAKSSLLELAADR